jgi:hypothetical protein
VSRVVAPSDEHAVAPHSHAAFPADVATRRTFPCNHGRRAL